LLDLKRWMCRCVTRRQSDPLDRLLLAQCEIETLKLFTADPLLKALPGTVAAN
jgi:PIN domain nuclease of toxin-antitoxin system